MFYNGRVCSFNPLECKCNYSATSSNIKLVHWPSMSRLLRLVQRGEDRAGQQPVHTPPRCTKCISASVQISLLLYNTPLLCGCNVPTKGLIARDKQITSILADMSRHVTLAAMCTSKSMCRFCTRFYHVANKIANADLTVFGICFVLI